MDSDSTLVTGSPLAARGPRRGAVLGERYEIVDALDADALSLTYKALDQESETHVLFRLLAPGALAEKDARSLVTRLSPLVGIGGRTLARVRDVDREGSVVFVVEPWPQGTTFRALLDGRRDKGAVFTSKELLPVLSALAEATLSLSEPWFHGDLRAHRIYVQADGVRVTGGFALAVLPGDVVVDALTEDVGLRRQFAPEVGDGLAGRPSDRWSVAALAWEALTGKVPEPGPKSAPATLGELGKVLLRYLDPDPTLRPPSLELLVTAVAKHAGVPAPKLVPEPFAIETEAPSDDKTQQVDSSMIVDEATTSRSLSLDRSLSAERPPGPNDTAKHAPVLADAPTVREKKEERDLSDIDPALLRAAAVNRSVTDSGTFELDARELKAFADKKDGKSEGGKRDGDLDPRLVRAALGVSLDDSRPKRSPKGGTQTEEIELTPSEDDAPTDISPSIAPMVRAGAKLPAPSKSAAPASVKSSAPRAPAAAARASAPAAARASAPSASPARAVQPAAPQPSPQPARPMPQPIAQAPQAMPPPQPLVATSPPPVMSQARAPEVRRGEPVTRPIARPSSQSQSGMLVIGGAVLVAVLILAFAFWFRSSH
jgi:hypothetical protein